MISSSDMPRVRISFPFQDHRIDGIDNGPRLFGGIQAANPPVRRVGFAADIAVFLHFVDRPGRGGFVVVAAFCKIIDVDPLVLENTDEEKVLSRTDAEGI